MVNHAGKKKTNLSCWCHLCRSLGRNVRCWGFPGRWMGRTWFWGASIWGHMMPAWARCQWETGVVHWLSGSYDTICLVLQWQHNDRVDCSGAEWPFKSCCHFQFILTVMSRVSPMMSHGQSEGLWEFRAGIPVTCVLPSCKGSQCPPPDSCSAYIGSPPVSAACVSARVRVRQSGWCWLQWWPRTDWDGRSLDEPQRCCIPTVDQYGPSPIGRDTVTLFTHDTRGASQTHLRRDCCKNAAHWTETAVSLADFHSGVNQ